MKRMMTILFCFFMVACSVLTGAQKRKLPPRKQSLLFDAIENKDIQTIASLMQRYDIESFVPKDLFEKKQEDLPEIDYENVDAFIEDIFGFISDDEQEEDVVEKKQEDLPEIDYENVDALIEDIFGFISDDEQEEDVVEEKQEDSSKIDYENVDALIEDIFGFISDDEQEEDVVEEKQEGDVPEIDDKNSEELVNEIFGFISQDENEIELLDEIFGFISDDEQEDVVEEKQPRRTEQKKSDDEALLKAIEADEPEGIKTIGQIFERQYKTLSLSKKVINQAFVKTVTGSTRIDLRPNIAQVFLEHSKIKTELEGQSLDRAFNKSIRVHNKKLFLTILADEWLRAKLYTQDETRDCFKMVLRYEAKRFMENRTFYLNNILSHADIRKKVKDFKFITPDMLNAGIEYSKKIQKAANYSKEEKALLKAIDEKDDATIKQLVKEHHEKLDKIVVSEAFFRTIKKRDKKDFELDLTKIFLMHSEVWEKLNGEVLDRAVAKFMRSCVRDLFSMILRHEELRGKLYRSKKTRKFVDGALEHAKKGCKTYLYEFLFYKDLRDRVKHLPFITEDVLKEARSFRPKEDLPEIDYENIDAFIEDIFGFISDDEQEDVIEKKPKKRKRRKNVLRKKRALFKAIQDLNVVNVRKILRKSRKDPDPEIINDAFVSVVEGRRERFVKVEIGELFLEHQEIRDVLNGEALDKAFIWAIQQRVSDFALEIVSYEKLRKKLYKSDNTKKSFNGALKQVAKYGVRFLEKILSSYPDLYEAFKDLDFIPKKILERASRSKAEKELLEAITQRRTSSAKKILREHHKDLSEIVVNEGFSMAVKGTNKTFMRIETAHEFLNYQEIKEALTSDTLDWVFARTITYSIESLFFRMLEDETIRRKLLKSEKERSYVDKALELSAKEKNAYLLNILLHEELKDCVQDRIFISQDLIAQARAFAQNIQLFESRSKEEVTLFEAIEKNRIQDVESIFSSRKGLSKEVINQAFICTMTGRRQKLKPKIALLFLVNQNIKKELEGPALERALERSIRCSFHEITSELLADENACKEMYNDQDSEKSCKEMLNNAKKYRRKIFKRILLHPVLGDKVKHFACVPLEIRAMTKADKMLLNAVLHQGSKEITFVINKHHKDFDKEIMNNTFVKGISRNDKKVVSEMALIFLKNSKIKDNLSGQSLDTAIIKSIRKSLRDVFDAIMHDKMLVKKVYVDDETKEPLEVALKTLSKKVTFSGWVRTFLAHQRLKNKLPLDMKNAFFKALVKVKILYSENKQAIERLLDDLDFCDAIQDSTLEDILKFYNDVFSGSNGHSKSAVNKVLKVLCSNDDFEERIFEICENKEYTLILDKFKDGDVAFQELNTLSQPSLQREQKVEKESESESEEEDDEEDEFIQGAEHTFVIISLTNAFHAQNSTYIKNTLKNKFDSIRPGELHFCFLICFYEKYYDGIKILLECCKFRNLLSGEKLFRHLESFEQYLKEGDKDDQKMTKNIVSQMCEYRLLKKRVVASIRKNKLEKLKAYLDC